MKQSNMEVCLFAWRSQTSSWGSSHHDDSDIAVTFAPGVDDGLRDAHLAFFVKHKFPRNSHAYPPAPDANSILTAKLHYFLD